MPFANQVLGPFRGLNQDENPYALNKNDLIVARNVVRRGNTWGTRPGTILEGQGQQYDQPLTGENPVQGLHEHRENSDEGRHLLAVSDSGSDLVFHEHNMSLTDSATITAGQDNVWTFANHNNLTYAAGGADGDHFWSWDGNTGNSPTEIALVDSAATALEPKFVFAWRGYLFINGLQDGTIFDNNPSTTRFCDFATDPTTVGNWSHGNTIGFRAFGSSHTTGMASFRDNNGSFLLVLHNDGIGSVTLDPTTGFNVPFQINDEIANGCVHQRAFVSLGLDAGDAIYMSDKGIHSLRQSQEHGNRADQFLTWKIREFFSTLNTSRKKFAVGAYDFVNGYCVWAVTTTGNSAHDKMLCLDVKGNEPITAENAVWSIWDLNGRNVNELKMLRDQDDEWRLYYGDTAGGVGYFSNSTFSDNNDTILAIASAPYTVKMQTPHSSYGSILSRKTLGDVMITLQPGGNYKPTMQFHFDYGQKVSNTKQLSMAAASGFVLGTDTLGVGGGVLGAALNTRDEKVYGTGSGRTIGFSVEHTGKNEPFWVGRIDHQVDIAGEDAGSAT